MLSAANIIPEPYRTKLIHLGKFPHSSWWLAMLRDWFFAILAAVLFFAVLEITGENERHIQATAEALQKTQAAMREKDHAEAVIVALLNDQPVSADADVIQCRVKVSLDGKDCILEAMPTMPAPTAGKRMVDAAGLARLLRPYPDLVAAVEHVGAMPGQGVTSMFSFDQAYGTALGALSALGIGYTLVRPQLWKKHHGITGAGMDGALGVVARRWPEMVLKKTEHGLADALLIADWLRQGRVIKP